MGHPISHSLCPVGHGARQSCQAPTVAPWPREPSRPTRHHILLTSIGYCVPERERGLMHWTHGVIPSPRSLVDCGVKLQTMTAPIDVMMGSDDGVQDIAVVPLMKRDKHKRDRRTPSYAGGGGRHDPPRELEASGRTPAMTAPHRRRRTRRRRQPLADAAARRHRAVIFPPNGVRGAAPVDASQGGATASRSP